MTTAKDIDRYVENQSPNFRRRYQQVQKESLSSSKYLIAHGIRYLRSITVDTNHPHPLSLEEWLNIYRDSESKKNELLELVLHPIYQLNLSIAMQTVFSMNSEEVYKALSDNNPEYKLLKEAIFIAALYKFCS
jgi:hypothetical protein